ncbi:PREDICTED: zinc finger CCCH domain-containing protein 62-like [Populus euphratica]|uniref:Zinc finger CCCH domain-containing protein 62-like n=1 Tax=Populus euphratica TaxID=75702 RepID=A0AAJ6UUN0_POPEU|nr:PREDICTED: zinc finger CCCH domain-containing protein 62-like [Populus euphratica]
MVTYKQKKPQDEQEEEEVYSAESGGSDPDYGSDTDPSYSIFEETRSNLSRLSIKKKSKSRVAKDLDLSFDEDPGEKETKLAEVDEKSYEEVQKIIQAGKLERLKVEQCKVYLRKNKLRLTGKKDILIQRIKEHQEILSGGGEKKYPISSFVLDCKGDACRGDIVMFDQNVYDKYNIASRSAVGSPIGTRMVAGKIVQESYGAAKQQHTFTIEVLWSKGENPLPPLHPLLIKGRNLYRMKTLRQRWEDEGERRNILLEKHLRGSLARSNRETRVLEKEGRKMLRVERALKKEETNKSRSQLNPRTSLNNGLSRMDQRQPLKCADRSPHRQGCEQPKLHANRGENDYRGQVPGNAVEYGDIQDDFCSRSPKFCRKPLASIHNSSPIRSPHRQGGDQQIQLCRYFAQGRCHYGHNCKFVHESREGQLCRYFALGRCFYGQDCKFVHESREGREQRIEERGGPCSPRREEWLTTPRRLERRPYLF